MPPPLLSLVHVKCFVYYSRFKLGGDYTIYGEQGTIEHWLHSALEALQNFESVSCILYILYICMYVFYV